MHLGLYSASIQRIFSLLEKKVVDSRKRRGEMYIASDITAIIDKTKDYYLLEHGEIAVVSESDVAFYDLHKNEITTKELHTATWDISAAEKGGFEHFMLKEISEQPDA